MTARRIDLDKLRELATDYPEMGHRERAAILQEHNRLHGRKLGLAPGVITPNAVAAALHAYRDGWGLGDQVKKEEFPELIPWTDLVPAAGRSYIIKNLRAVAKLRRGMPVAADEAKRARTFERELRTAKPPWIIDVLDGVPYRRPALAERGELDRNGNLIEIVAFPEDPAKAIIREIEKLDPNRLRRVHSAAERRLGEAL